MKLTAKDIAERYNTNVNRIYYYLKKVLGDKVRILLCMMKRLF